MSPRRKLAQLLVVGVTGTEDAVDIVRREQIGGVFIGSWTDLGMLSDGGVASVQKVAAYRGCPASVSTVRRRANWPRR